MNTRSSPPKAASQGLSSTSPLRRALSYRKFKNAKAVTVLLLDGGYHLHQEAFDALVRLGHKVYRANVKYDTTQACMTSLLEGLVAHRPDFVLAINHIGFDADGAMGNLIDSLNIPLACWYCDNPMFVLRDGNIPAPLMSSLFVWEQALIPTMRRLGATDVHHLPLGCDVTRFSQPAPLAPCWPVSFVGDSMQRPLNIWRKRVGKKGESQAARWRNLLNQKRQPLAEMALDDGCDASTWDAVALGTYQATHDYRLACVQAVAGEGLCIFGDAGWRSKVRGARWMGEVVYGEGLASVYARSAISLNATSLQMPTAVNQRVFDVPMAGGFVLSDHQADLASFFELGREAIAYKDMEELADLVRWYLVHPQQRTAVTQAAKKRIMACHTYDHRLAYMVDKMAYRHKSSGPHGPLPGHPKVSGEATS